MSSNANLTPKIMPKAVTRSPIIKFKNSGERVGMATILVTNEDDLHEQKKQRIFDFEKTVREPFSSKERCGFNNPAGFNPEVFRNLQSTVKSMRFPMSS